MPCKSAPWTTLGLAAWTLHDAVLREMAALWIVSDPVGPSDAAVVLGGGVEDRRFAAAQYYPAGLVKKILVSNAYLGPAQKLGTVMSSASADKAVLLTLGVPVGTIEVFGSDLRNTDEESAGAPHLDPAHGHA